MIIDSHFHSACSIEIVLISSLNKSAFVYGGKGAWPSHPRVTLYIEEFRKHSGWEPVVFSTRQIQSVIIHKTEFRRGHVGRVKWYQNQSLSVWLHWSGFFLLITWLTVFHWHWQHVTQPNQTMFILPQKSVKVDPDKLEESCTWVNHRTCFLKTWLLKS